MDGARISIDTCHRLMEERTVQEFMDALRDEVEQSDSCKGRDPAYIESEWQEYCKKQIAGNGRHVQVLFFFPHFPLGARVLYPLISLFLSFPLAAHQWEIVSRGLHRFCTEYQFPDSRTTRWSEYSTALEGAYR